MKIDNLIGNSIKTLLPDKVTTIADDIVRTMEIKNTTINKILSELNRGELNYGDLIEVEGILSSFAFIDTRASSSINRIKPLGFEDDKLEISVEAKPLPLKKPAPEGNTLMRFLYLSSQHHPFYIGGENQNDGPKLTLNDSNKYVPLIIENSKFIDRNLELYSFVCKIREFPHDHILLKHEVSNPYIKEIKSFFNDTTYPVYSNFYLEVVEYKLSDLAYKNKKVRFSESPNVSFDVEITVEVEGDNKYIGRRMNKILDSMSFRNSKGKPFLKAFSQEDNILYYMVKGSVYICRKNKIITFSIDYSMDNVDKFRQDYSELLQVYELFKKDFKGNYTISYMSDETKMSDFIAKSVE